MRPNKLWTKPPVLILLAVHLFPWTIYTQEADCLPHVRVHRNTVMNASSGEDLRMECPVHFCSDAQPVISWCKLDDSNNCSPFNRSARTETHWQNLTYNTGISFLNMKDVSTNDTGQYRCQYRSDMSHSIKIRVSERTDISTVGYEKNETTSFEHPNPELEWLLPYIYPAVGILGLVVVVITTSILLMQRNRGRPKNTDPTENKYMAIPMTQQALPHANISPQPYPRASPRQSVPTIYDNAPSRRPSSAHAPPTRPAANHKAAPEDRDQGNRKAGERERDEESLLYAALDHQALPGATGRPQRPQEECSEYAAIRVH
ncbi:B- and T-lymphocyte attenuator-like [Hypomesus transpacificus]|uniref:B- and T-lymphocyte attenuator-like n=1 Tax=Hypomesus transpacificus TaxID=137520 RepID=UPI001F07DC4E|nr:B- and T-lymphocyte attenuator-like [Hypomesus transpacificus]XP_046886624.1 B- and T-lymphocyte attenuator-like [Hypomesus transpacificus]